MFLRQHQFVTASIDEVYETLIIAAVLVLVILIFLQDEPIAVPAPPAR